MKSLCVRMLVAMLALGATAAWGDNYPSRPVRVIVPFAAGGTFDLVARVISLKLAEAWGQQVVVDNRPGGGTLIATEMIARANPDGYTIYLSPNGLSANPSLHRKLPYNMRDLAPVVLVASQPMALGAHPSFKAGSIRELIDIARATPGKLSYGTAGVGSGGHLAGEIFKAMAGLDIVHISYKGGNVAMIEVMANQIPLVMTGLPNLLPQYKAGRIKILGITDARRSAVAKDIPAIAETVPGYEFRNWFGLVVPVATPRQIQQRINGDVNRIIAVSETRQKLLDEGFDVLGGTSDEFAALIRTDTEKFARIIKQTGIGAN